MTPRKLLFYLRAKQQDVVGYDPKRKTCARPEAWQKLVSTEVDNFLEKNHRLKAEEFGSYEDVLFDRLRLMVENTSPECQTTEFAIGELFLSYPQAKIIRLPSLSSGYLIALHTHLCHLLRYVTEGSSIRIRLDNGLPVNMQRESLYPWFDRLIRFFFLRQGSLPPIPEPTNPAELIMVELTYVASLLWIICHEYGHYLAGHFQKGRLSTLQIGGREVETCEGCASDSTSWEREFEADVIGCDLLIRAVMHDAFRYGDAGATPEGDRIQFACWGVDVAIGLPPAHLRLANILDKRPKLFSCDPMYASIITGYFDAIYKGLPGSLSLREP
jgi:hypothetical protein